MSVIGHLEALRRALIISGAAWLVLSVASWFLTVDILHLLQHRAQLGSFVFLNPTGAFLLRLKLAIYTGTLLASPIIIWQAWWFISPGLRVHERRVVLPLTVATSFFFLVGVGFSLYALPLILHVLTGFAPSGVLSYLPNGDNFLSFLLGLCLAFGLVFELPVILWTLGMLGIVDSAWLWRHRLYWLLGLGLVANLMTPGADPLTPLVVFLPLVVFYLGSTALLKMSGK